MFYRVVTSEVVDPDPDPLSEVVDPHGSEVVDQTRGCRPGPGPEVVDPDPDPR